MVRAAIVLVLLVFLPSGAHADKRLAVLIGNEAYAPAIGALANPHNDVALLEHALKGLGFEVAVERDAGLGALTRAVNAYARRLQAAGPNAIGLFYYSGHGASDGSTNYLIPIDVKTTEAGELWDQSLRLTEITRKLKTEAGNATHFVVFDACRNTLKLTQPGSRAVVQSKGFVPVAQENGMLIAYATAEGELASDLGTAAGPYAKALAEEIVKPGIEAVVMFRAVQRRVRAAIRQEPYLGFNALGDVYLAGLNVEPPKLVAPAPLTPAAPARLSEAAEAWTLVKDTTNISGFEAFIRRFGDTFYGDLAKARLADLKQQAEATQREAAKKRESATDFEAGYRQRVAMLQQQEVDRRRSNAEAAKKHEPAVEAGYRQRVAMLQQQEDEKRRAEAEEAKKREQGADATSPGRVFRDCPDCPEMVVVPAGQFTMGSPKDEPQRDEREDQLPVTIAKPFAVGRYAVTRGEFGAFVTATGHKTDGGCFAYMGNTEWMQQADRNWRSPGFMQNDRHPVVCVNWADAEAFAAWLSRKKGNTYRLLSEAEREYAARAGTTTPFWWGASITPQQANYDGTANPYKGGGSKGEWRKATVPVDTFKADRWGLFNVHGNVWEWTEDCWNDKNAGNPGDGSARTSGDCSHRALRGGSWINVPQFLRSAFRVGWVAVLRYDSVGFRLARTLNP